MARKSQVKTDIAIDGYSVTLSKRAVLLLDARAGDVLRAYESPDGNVYIYCERNRGDLLSGRLFGVSSGLRCKSKSVATAIAGRACFARYRVGDVVERGMCRMLNVITRINYGVQECKI